MKVQCRPVYAIMAAMLGPKTHVYWLYDIVAVVLILIPFLLFGFGIRDFLRFIYWRAKADSTQGDQNGWKYVPSGSLKGTSGYSPIIVFTAKNGQFYQCNKCVVYYGQPKLTSEQLGVLYDPNNPEDSCQNDFYAYPNLVTCIFVPLLFSAFCYPAWVLFADNFER